MGAGKLAEKVFSADQLAQLKRVTASRAMQEALGRRPHRGQRSPGLASTILGPATDRLSAMAMGHITGGPAGALVGAGLQGSTQYMAGRRAFNQMQRAMREPGIRTPPPIGDVLKRGAKGLAKAPVTLPVAYHRALGQANMISNAMGAYDGKNQDTGQGAKVSAVGGDVAPILATIRGRETGGHKTPYTATTGVKGQSASGAYQFIDSTWKAATRKHGIGTQYDRAKDAPPEVQDKIAELEVREILRQTGGDVSKVPIVWFAGNPNAKELTAEQQAANPRETLAGYQRKWLADYQRHATGTRAATGGRIGRAAGGKVSSATHERLVQRLMALADKARREVNTTTKPLLGLHDNQVAHALAAANRAI
jgi:hypothetical protein